MNRVNNIENAVILITGGTGTFGSAFLDRCLQQKAAEIRILSRDEKKQYDMMQKYKLHPNIKFYIGDIRDKASVDNVMKNVDYVFHAAAMKQVPICENFPLEAIKTNILGSENVLTSAIEHDVKKVICLSTDKAVYPISTMGTTKLCMEKIALAKSKMQTNTTIVITRFCNLIASNGSVVPLFLNQIKNQQPLTITDPRMTRFMMSLQEAMDLVEKALVEGNNGEIYIKLTKPLLIQDLITSICKFTNTTNDYPINIIGARPGERQHESLLTFEEAKHAFCYNDYIVINSQYNNLNTTYSSDVMELMNENEILSLLHSIQE